MPSSDLVNGAAGVRRLGRAVLQLAALLALIGVVAATACSGDAEEHTAPETEHSGDTSPAGGTGLGTASLSVGDCVLMEELRERVVPCHERHHYEVVGLAESAAPPGAPHPVIGADASTAEMQRQLHDRCIEQFEHYSGRTPEEAAVAVLTRPPDEQAWSEGDRRVPCIATKGLGTDPGGGGPRLEGSLRRS